VQENSAGIVTRGTTPLPAFKHDAAATRKEARVASDAVNGSAADSLDGKPVATPVLSSRLGSSFGDERQTEDRKPEAAHGMTLPFKPLSLTFYKMNYYVPLPAVRLICSYF
jgi:hypothetical protein